MRGEGRDVRNTYCSFLLGLQLFQLIVKCAQLTVFLLEAAEVTEHLNQQNSSDLLMMTTTTTTKRRSNAYLSFSCSNSAAFSWFCSSFLGWLASRSELMEATCSTSWLFSVCVSFSWAVRASTWAKCLLTSASSVPIYRWHSAGTKDNMKTQHSQGFLLFAPFHDHWPLIPPFSDLRECYCPAGFCPKRPAGCCFCSALFWAPRSPLPVSSVTPARSPNGWPVSKGSR